MLCNVWNMAGIVRKQASIIETYKGIDIYTISSEEDSVCLMINDALLRMGFNSVIPAIRQRIDQGDNFAVLVRDNVLSRLANYANCNGLLNMQEARAVGLFEEAQEALCWREINKEIEQDKREEKARQKALQEIEARKEQLAKAKEAFIAGERINVDDFQGLLVDAGIWENVPIKTKGWINNKLVKISHVHGYQAYTKGDSVFKWVNVLLEASKTI